jgi:hypothetical protein
MNRDSRRSSRRGVPSARQQLACGAQWLWESAWLKTVLPVASSCWLLMILCLMATGSEFESAT